MRVLHVFFLWISILHTRGESISVSNGGFEKDANFDTVPIPSNTVYYHRTDIIQNWLRYDPSGIMEDESVGVENPEGGNSFDDTIYGTSCPEGTACAYVAQWSLLDVNTGEIGIFRKLLDHQIIANTTYTLTAFVGNPKYNCFSHDSTTRNMCQFNNAFPGYRVQLTAGADTVLAEDNNLLYLPDGTWGLSTVKYTTLHDNAATLRVRLINKNIHDNGGAVTFDDVQLSVVPLTISPTQNPSVHPTKPPTKPPSKYPTTAPTKHPSNNPTKAPTGHPTKIPTSNPIIDTMTMDPSSHPTQMTHNPSVSSIAPSIIPTDALTLYTTHVFYTSTEDGESNVAMSQKQVDVIIFSGTGLLSGLVAICVIYIIYKKCKTRDTSDIEERIATERSDDYLVKVWLEVKLKLPQYVDNFVENGYNMHMILNTVVKEDLVAIGIRKKGHQALLMSEIEILRDVVKKKRAKRAQTVAKEELRFKISSSDAPVYSLNHDQHQKKQSKVTVIVDDDAMSVLGDDDDDEIVMKDIEEFLKGDKETKGNELVAKDEFIVQDDEEDCTDSGNESDEKEFEANDPVYITNN